MYVSDYLTNCSYAAPDSPPENITATVRSSTSIEVTWNEVLPINQNGDIVRYNLTFERLGDGAKSTVSLPASSRGHTITGLQPYAEYNISVRASTQVGPGPLSVPLTIVTEEAGKSIMLHKTIVYRWNL